MRKICEGEEARGKCREIKSMRFRRREEGKRESGDGKGGRWRRFGNIGIWGTYSSATEDRRNK